MVSFKEESLLEQQVLLEQQLETNLENQKEIQMKNNLIKEQQEEQEEQIQEQEQNIKEHTEEAVNELAKEKCNHIFKNTPTFYFLEDLGFKQCKEIFNIMEACKCCERHQINKPTNTFFIDGYVPHYDDYEYTNQEEQNYYNIQKRKENENLKKCNCSCRHICRSMCREVNDLEYEYE